MRLLVGTRGSKMALIQTSFVVGKLVRLASELKIETKIIKTTGDMMPDEPLLHIKEKGIFEKEVDRAVVEGKADFAVHSMKDVPVLEDSEVEIVAVPQRDPPNDAFVSKLYRTLSELPAGCEVGTGSPRREAQLRRIRPELVVKPVRGNVDTRVKKLEQGLYDALILAEAGLRRLGLDTCYIEPLSMEDFTPSPGQGALAVVARRDSEAVATLKMVNHPTSMAEIVAERAFIREMGGGCKVPMGAVARSMGNRLSLLATILSPDGKEKIQAIQDGLLSSAEHVGVTLAEKMRELGSEDLVRR